MHTKYQRFQNQRLMRPVPVVSQLTLAPRDGSSDKKTTEQVIERGTRRHKRGRERQERQRQRQERPGEAGEAE